jgi:hypothetical protein
MSKEKQIEEMASIIFRSGLSFKYQAECLYNAGYRKQSEGEWKQADSGGNHVNGFMVCSVCDVMIPECKDAYYCLSRLDYCPRCGAKMKGGA